MEFSSMILYLKNLTILLIAILLKNGLNRYGIGLKFHYKWRINLVRGSNHCNFALNGVYPVPSPLRLLTGRREVYKDMKLTLIQFI